MKKETFIPLVLVLGSVLLFLGFGKMESIESGYHTISNEDKATLALDKIVLNDYKSWHRITEGNPNTGDPTGFLGGRHKGLEAYREVYINKIGEAVNKGSAPYKYPSGTVLVKEEYKNEEAWKAEKKPKIKLMVKLEPGASPETGDWGFASKLDVNKLASGKSGKAKFCAGCHVFVAAQGDYVFMNADFLKTE